MKLDAAPVLDLPLSGDDPPPLTKCWGDALMPDGRPSGEACNRFTGRRDSLCDRCADQIVLVEYRQVAA